MQLKKWCEENPYGNKILITDNSANVNRLKRITNAENNMVITNLKDMKLSALAKEIVIEFIAEMDCEEISKIGDASHDISVLLVYDLLKKSFSAISSRKYNFIPEESLSISTAEELLRTMNVVRSGKFTDVSFERIDELKKLIEDYENKLVSRNLYDEISYISKAINFLSSSEEHSAELKAYAEEYLTCFRKNNSVAVFSYMFSELTFLERTFLEIISPEFILIDVEIPEEERNVNVEFCHTYGQMNEIQMVISDIEEKGLPLGKVNILYSSSEYELMIRNSLLEKNIPHASVSGYSILDKTYIQLVLSILVWYESNYDYKSYKKVVDNILVRMGSDYNFGRKAGIGWGLDRYFMFLDKMNNDRENYIKLLIKHKKIRKPKTVEDIAISEIKTCSEEYLNFMAKLCELFQNYSNNSKVSAGIFYRNLIQIVEENTNKNIEKLVCTIKNAEDPNSETIKKYKKLIKVYQKEKIWLTKLKELRLYFDEAEEFDSFQEMICFVKEKIMKAKISDKEKSNAITVTKMKGIDILERPYQYCIGMSYDAFKNRAIDSPVVNDEMMLKVLDKNAGYVEQITYANKNKIEHFMQMINTQKYGELTICACTYDTRNLREISVSEAFRVLHLKSGGKTIKEIGYPNCVGETGNYSIDKQKLYPRTVEDITEKNNTDNNTDKNNSYVASNNEYEQEVELEDTTFAGIDFSNIEGEDINIDDISIAEVDIQKSNFENKESIAEGYEKEFDAKESGSKDSLENGAQKYTGVNFIKEEIVNGHRLIHMENISATAWQNAMICPYKLEYDLQYFDAEDYEKNISVWLPANERGNLFHQVFEEYCNECLKGKNVGQNDFLQENKLLDIYNQAIEEFRILVPSGSVLAYETEKEKMYEPAKTYLQELYEDLKTSNPKWVVDACEREFTSEKYYIDADGQYCDPNTCDAICYSFHGVIDRVDAYDGGDGKKHIRIIDYKSGKKDKLEEKIKKKTQIQHAIYSISVPEVTDEFEYDFPCDANKKINKQGDEIEKFSEAYTRRLANILLNKIYEEPQKDACEFCDYKAICVKRMNL